MLEGITKRRSVRNEITTWHVLGIQFTDHSTEKSIGSSDSINGGFANIAGRYGKISVPLPMSSVQRIWLLFSRARTQLKLKPAVKHVMNSCSNREPSEIGKEGKPRTLAFSREILCFDSLSQFINNQENKTCMKRQGRDGLGFLLRPSNPLFFFSLVLSSTTKRLENSGMNWI